MVPVSVQPRVWVMNIAIDMAAAEGGAGTYGDIAYMQMQMHMHMHVIHTYIHTYQAQPRSWSLLFLARITRDWVGRSRLTCIARATRSRRVLYSVNMHVESRRTMCDGVTVTACTT